MAGQRPSTVRSAAFRRSALSLAKAFSMGLKIGRVGREDTAAWHRPPRWGSARDGLLVARQVVEDDDVTGPQRRDEDLLDVGEEALAD